MSSDAVVKRSVVKRMSIVSGGGGDDLDFESGGGSSSSFRSSSRKSVSTSSSSSSFSGGGHQVYRGMSPTTASRLENRVKELEEALELERTAHLRTEKELTEVRFSFDGLHERLEESEAETFSQIEIVKRKDQELVKAKKDLEIISAQHEAAESALKKRHQDIINDLTEQLEKANKLRARIEKEKQQISIEIESYVTQLDAATKGKSYSDSKLEGLEEQIRKLKAQVEELTRIKEELSNARSKLAQENAELLHQVHELETNYGSSSKVKIQIQTQLDDVKTKLEEESRLRSQLELQLGGLHDELSLLKGQLDEESEAASGFKAQALKWQTDYQTIKSKYDKDVVARSEEVEEVRRKLTLRITELETEVEQFKGKATRAEKEKNKLAVEINEIVVQLEGAEAAAADTAKRLKQAEHGSADLARRVDELTTELRSVSGDKERFQAEAAQFKHSADDLQAKLDVANREIARLTDALRESESNVKDLTRQSQEWAALKIELAGERDALATQLAEQREGSRDIQAKLDSVNAAFNQTRAELEARLAERSEELENTKQGAKRTIDELQRINIELEAKLKGEASRLKKKYETEIHEFEIQIDNLNRTGQELAKNNKNLAIRLKETELALDSERRALQDARDSASAAEKKVVTLLSELEDIRIHLDGADKARKHAESELHDSSTHINEINITITSLTADKRRLESDLTVLARDRDDAASARRAAEERAEKLSLELARITDQLRVEKETVSKLETVRKLLEVSVKEITIRLEEVESTKDGKKTIVKLQARIVELEHELESLIRREREAVAENSKLKKQLTELRTQAESDRRLVIEYTETINILETRIITIKRQLEQSEEVLNITMAKYRKTQQLLEEAERRADKAENNVTVVRRQSVNVVRGPGGATTTRAMSVSRDTRYLRT